MIVAVVFGVVLLVVLGVSVKRGRGLPDPEPELDPQAAYKTAVELHAIRRRLDVALTRSEIGADAARLRRDIAESLERRPGNS